MTSQACDNVPLHLTQGSVLPLDHSLERGPLTGSTWSFLLVSPVHRCRDRMLILPAVKSILADCTLWDPGEDLTWSLSLQGAVMVLAFHRYQNSSMTGWERAVCFFSSNAQLFQ